MFVDPPSHPIFLRFSHKFSIFSGLTPHPFLEPQKKELEVKTDGPLLEFKCKILATFGKDKVECPLFGCPLLDKLYMHKILHKEGDENDTQSEEKK